MIEVDDKGPDDPKTNSNEFKHLLEDLYFRLEERDKWAEHSMKFLLFGNGGGVALIIAFVGSQRAAIDTNLLLAAALTCFLTGVIAQGVVVIYSAHCARVGRRDVRDLLEGYLEGKWSYKSAFFRLGKIKSKWKGASRVTLLSFILFIAGVLASSFYLWDSYPPEAHGKAPRQVVSNSA